MTVPNFPGRAPDRLALPRGAGFSLPRGAATGEALSVLIVDDEAEVREELTVALGRRGWSVLSAGSARMALCLLASRPDVGALVTDVRMPGMDGIAMAEAALAGRREAEALEVLLVTGYASVAQGLAASRIGAFGVLHKPMRGADLAQLVADALASAAGRRRAARSGQEESVHRDLPPRPSYAQPAAAMLPLAERQALSPLAADPAPATERRAQPRPGLDEGSDGRLVEKLADRLADARALEDGLALPRPSPVYAHALMSQVATQLRSQGAHCSRRITLQPDADPAFEIDAARLLQAIDLLARRAFGGQAGTAELSLDAGAGQARLDLLLRPEKAEPVEPEPQPERGLPVAVARRLVAALGGRLDAWTIPTGGLRARLVIQAG